MVWLIRFPAWLLWNLVALVDLVFYLPALPFVFFLGPGWSGLVAWAVAGAVLAACATGEARQAVVGCTLILAAVGGAILWLAPWQPVKDFWSPPGGNLRIHGRFQPRTGRADLDVEVRMVPQEAARAFETYRHSSRDELASAAFNADLRQRAAVMQRRLIPLCTKSGLRIHPARSTLRWRTRLWSDPLGAGWPSAFDQWDEPTCVFLPGQGRMKAGIRTTDRLSWSYLQGLRVEDFCLIATVDSLQGREGEVGFALGTGAEKGRPLLTVTIGRGQAMLKSVVAEGDDSRLLSSVEAKGLESQEFPIRLKMIRRGPNLSLYVGQDQVARFRWPGKRGWLDQPCQVGLAVGSGSKPFSCQISSFEVWDLAEPGSP